MLRIGRLRITLPPGFDGNPEQVARLVADELAQLPLPATAGERRIEHLALPAMEVGPRAREGEVAAQTAQAILQAIPRGR